MMSCEGVVLHAATIIYPNWDVLTDKFYVTFYTTLAVHLRVRVWHEMGTMKWFSYPIMHQKLR